MFQRMMLVLFVGLLVGCNSKPSAHTIVPVANIQAPEPPDCFHEMAPKLAELEKKYGPMVIDNNVTFAAERNDPSMLWYVHKVQSEVGVSGCAGFGSTLKDAVSAALVDCRNPPRHYGMLDAEKQANLSKNKAAYQSIVDGQMCPTEKK